MGRWMDSTRSMPRSMPKARASPGAVCGRASRSEPASFGASAPNEVILCTRSDMVSIVGSPPERSAGLARSNRGRYRNARSRARGERPVLTIRTGTDRNLSYRQMKTNGSTARLRKQDPIMTATVPQGYTSVAPWIVTDDTGVLLDFITAAFGGVELARVAVEDGSIGHAEIRVGDTVLLAFDRREDWPVMPSLLRVFVPDADAAFEQAVAAGA